LQRAKELGIDLRFLSQSSTGPTGISCVILDAEGRAEHQIPRPAAYDFVSLNAAQLAELTKDQPRWICYGTLANVEPGPRALLDRLLAANTKAKRFYDLNLRPRCWTRNVVVDLMTLASGVKLNDDETGTLAALFGWPANGLSSIAEMAARQFELELVCITRGPDGCALWSNGHYVESPGFRVNVSDTVGAGDAFSAALLHGLHHQWGLADVAEFANRVGALVASRAGATPAWTELEARNLKGP
jgi:fructokinase